MQQFPNQQSYSHVFLMLYHWFLLGNRLHKLDNLESLPFASPSRTFLYHTACVKMQIQYIIASVHVSISFSQTPLGIIMNAKKVRPTRYFIILKKYLLIYLHDQLQTSFVTIFHYHSLRIDNQIFLCARPVIIASRLLQK